MKKLLLAVSILWLAAGCKTKKPVPDENTTTDSLWEAPKPGVDNPQKYDSLKRELDKRRKNKH